MTNAWVNGESPLVDERKFTPWGAAGYHAWNAFSPELEFCATAADLAGYVGGLVLETGAGQGYVTRRVGETAEQYQVYESMPSLRNTIPDGNWTVMDTVSPSKADIARCSLLIVDSGMQNRIGEIAGWANNGHENSLLLMHDAGNGHEDRGSHFTHIRYWGMIKELGIPGIRYANPRGSFLGWRTQPTDADLEYYSSLLPIQK